MRFLVDALLDHDVTLEESLATALHAMIGKTRQNGAADSRAEVAERFDPEVGRARGMLRRPLSAGKMWHARRSPAAELLPWIAHYWMIRWDLRGCPPHTAESLPHPNVHLIFEDGRSVIAGVHTHKFQRLLEGRAQVFGVKFRPGGFRPFLKSAVASLANRIVPAHRIFGEAMEPLDAILLSSAKDAAKIEAANDFFRQRVPEMDPHIALSTRLVDLTLNNPEIKTVDELALRAAIGKRSLQRLFKEYVGVSPKWVIRRYRLHELIERFNSRKRLDWSQTALDLGYSDQAHLINDFKAIVGYTPSEYRKLLQKGSSDREGRAHVRTAPDHNGSGTAVGFSSRGWYFTSG